MVAISGVYGSTIFIRLQAKDDASKVFAAVNKSIRSIDKGLQDVNKQANTFDMRMLSLLFSGMALKRAFTAAIRSIYNSFKKAEGNTSALSEATTRLSAGWEFLKFSIFNALDQPIIISFIDGIIKVINWTSDMINKYPALGIAIIAAFGVLAAGGTVMLMIGQMSSQQFL